MKKNNILLLCVYITAFLVNSIPSIKYPDTNLSIINLIASTIFVITLVAVVIKGATNSMIKILKYFFMIGFISGLIIFIIKVFEDILIKNTILDVISSIQYPIYLLFYSPFFGINYIVNTDYGYFVLIISIFYIMAFLLFSRLQQKRKSLFLKERTR